ncbi:MAG: hypothetical protein H6R18_2000, partial [Proteobacteria bacterium]|nr:hypothetical protein [Pseudomonadota bacterium]
MKTQPFHTLLRRLALLPLLLLPILAQAQVELPNGTVNAPVVDMKVKVLGGVVTVDRQWWDGNWRLNIRWNAAELSGAAWSPGE